MPTKGRSHAALELLATKIDQLGEECPWTAAQRPEDMLFHLRSEIMETEAALREKSVDAEALTKELGDVLFCALLLARVCERDAEVLGGRNGERIDLEARTVGRGGLSVAAEVGEPRASIEENLRSRNSRHVRPRQDFLFTLCAGLGP